MADLSGSFQRSPWVAILSDDPQYKYGQAAMDSAANPGPVYSNAQGLAVALKGALGGYFAGQAKDRVKKREKDYGETLAKALQAAKGWTNPDMQAMPGQVAQEGYNATAANVGNMEPRRYLAPGENVQGGTNAMAQVLAGNQDTAGLGLNLQFQEMQNQQKIAAEIEAEKRRAALALQTDAAKTKAERDYKASPAYLEQVAAEAKARREPMADRLAVAAAGKPSVSVEVKGETKGVEAAWKNAADEWKVSQSSGLQARKNQLLYKTARGAMEKFKTGAMAEKRLSLAQVASDVLGIKSEGMAEGELLKSISRRLELAATPKGQGQITEAERAIFRETIPSLATSPEGVLMILDVMEKLDAYDLEVEKIYTESARNNKGSPNPVDVAERLQQLGPPPDVSGLQAPAPAASTGGYSIRRLD